MNTTEHSAEKGQKTGATVIISVNPVAGAASAKETVQQTQAAIENRGFSVLQLSDIAQIKQEAIRLHQAGSLRAVIAAGGDGTLALLANTLPADIPLAPLPLGTENLLAKYYDIKCSPVEIADLVAKGEIKCVDAGVANGKKFLLMASCGFDADVVTRLHQRRTGHISHASWARPIWKSVRKYKYPELRLFTDSHRTPIKARWSFVFNFPCYALGLPIASHADPGDGQFDLCTFRGGNLLNGLIYLTGVVLRRHRGWRDTNFADFEKLRIESDSEVPFQLDGDPGGVLPLEISVQPGGLTLLLPQGEH